ncbi:MAG: ATP synthase F1 subunit epsilon [Candidatus Fischerbacteria bacterium RBG_13_37_8]|uniref:ATP synthase epsilon chain n=1 Tax=Candidatus Fischerbacteria bacterium RBG_13_37_8 TaxID=1817863 RepID=A0A1F5VTF7_9BACT|nr:MAG: ATP synthase F1 subunit epsilon [Candidatus Fischerbacteria bacterium RBG_13_37_8]
MNKLPDRLVLEIVTPERQVIKAVVDEVVLPGTMGYLGILPGHTPLLTTLSIGTVTYRQKGKKFYLFLSEGFAEILPDRVIVLAEVVEKPEEIDVERAKLAKERAEKRLADKGRETNVDRAMTSLKRAIARIDVGIRH